MEYLKNVEQFRIVGEIGDVEDKMYSKITSYPLSSVPIMEVEIFQASIGDMPKEM